MNIYDGDFSIKWLKEKSYIIDIGLGSKYPFDFDHISALLQIQYLSKLSVWVKISNPEFTFELALQITSLSLQVKNTMLTHKENVNI